MAPLYVLRPQLNAVAPAALSVTNVDELLVRDWPTWIYRSIKLGLSGNARATKGVLYTHTHTPLKTTTYCIQGHFMVIRQAVNILVKCTRKWDRGWAHAITNHHDNIAWCRPTSARDGWFGLFRCIKKVRGGDWVNCRYYCKVKEITHLPSLPFIAIGGVTHAPMAIPKSTRAHTNPPKSDLRQNV